MGWFKQQQYMYMHLWIILSAAALYVSCQELSSTLRAGNRACQEADAGNYACRGEDVDFNCTIRGSSTLSSLILTWNVPGYIEQGNPLRFNSEDMPNMSRTSMINGNVTATLISNSNDTGVRVLTSTLRIRAVNASSVVTCNSETSGGMMSTPFNISVFPNNPQNVIARQVSQECNLSVTWNHPANTDINGLTYKIYIPSRDIVIANVSETSLEFNVENCRDDNVRVLVAAVNRFGCEGQNSSAAVQVQPIPLEMQTASLGPAGAIAGYVAVAAVVVVVVVAVLVVLVWLAVRKVKAYCKRKREIKQLTIESYCVKVFDDLKRGVHPSELVQEYVLQSLEKKSATDVQRGLISFIDNNLKSATRISFVLRRLKRLGLSVMSEFDTELKSARSSVTMDRLIKEANKGKRGELTQELDALLKELIGELNKANSERVKELLLNLFKELRNAKEEKGELMIVEENLWKMEEKAEESSAYSFQDNLRDIIKKLTDEDFVMEWMEIIQPVYGSEPNSQYPSRSQHGKGVSGASKPKKGSKRKLVEESIEMESPHGTTAI